MIYSTKDLLAKGETEYSIRNKVKDKKLFLIEYGIYSDFPNPYVNEHYISIKYPNAVITGLSALYIYDLVDHIPDKFYIATEQHSFPIRRKDVVQTYQDSSFFLTGKTTIKHNNESINIYDLERMLIEVVRLKEKYSPEIYYSAIASFRKIKDKIDFYKLNEYLKHFKNGDLLLQKIKEII